MSTVVGGYELRPPRYLPPLPTGGYVWTEDRTTFDGQIIRRTVAVTGWTAIGRENCYCCSCYNDPQFGTREGSDPYCRNHGFAGTRRCDVHNMPGDKYAGELYDVDGKVDLRKVLLESVQEHRAVTDRR